MTLQLYHCERARSMRPLWTLEEMGLDYELITLPFPPRYLAKEYLQVNPLGTVPCLVDGIGRYQPIPCRFVRSDRSRGISGGTRLRHVSKLVASKRCHLDVSADTGAPLHAIRARREEKPAGCQRLPKMVSCPAPMRRRSSRGTRVPMCTAFYDCRHMHRVRIGISKISRHRRSLYT